MEQVINVERRTSGGKGAARKVRATGKVPGVLYGHKQTPQLFAVDPKVLHKTVSASGFGRNTVLKIEGLERSCLALLKDTQVDSLHRKLLHVDLIEVQETEQVSVDVPLVFTGKPAGVTAGGVLQILKRTIRLSCRPLSIPKEVQVDTTPLNLNQVLHVKEIPLPEGTQSIDPGHFPLASVHAPAAEKAEETTAAEGAAAGTAAAAPAAAAAKTDKDKK